MNNTGTHSLANPVSRLDVSWKQARGSFPSFGTNMDWRAMPGILTSIISPVWLISCARISTRLWPA